MKRLFIFMLLMPFYIRAQEQYTFSNLSLSDGLSQITVICIYQDSKGYMWFGTRNGLNRLNLSQNTFTTYYPNPEQKLSLPHNVVHSVCFDSSGNLWVGTGEGLSKYNLETDNFTHIDLDGLLINNIVNNIIHKEDKLYLATSKAGLIIYNIQTGDYQAFRHNPQDPHSITHNHVRTLLLDKDNNLWLGTHHNGINLLKQGEQEFISYTEKDGLSNDYIRCITQLPDGNIWVGTYNGLNIINPATKQITPYNYGTEQDGLSHYSFYSIYIDNAQTVWIGSWAGGVDYYNTYSQKFRFYSPSLLDGNLKCIVGAMLETESHVYFATEGAGLLEWDKQKETFQNYKLFTGNNRIYSRNVFKSLYFDGDKILCGTNIGTIYAFDLRTHRFSPYHNLHMEQPIYYLGRNRQGDLIIGNVSDDNGLILLSKDGSTKESFPVSGRKAQTFANVRCVLEVEPDRFLIGTRNEGLYDYNTITNELIQYKRESDTYHLRQIPENYVSSIFKDHTGNIWIGTFGGGICSFDLTTGQFSTLNKKKGLLNNNVCSIVEDETGHLWVSTIYGISNFNPETQNFINYSYDNGIKINEFTPHSGAILSDGSIVFSGSNGFIAFDPRQMLSNPHLPPIVLRNLFVNNEEVYPGDGSGILSMQLDKQDRIELKYNQSNISIQYSALNYLYPEQNRYTYMLEGFDKQWNEVGTRHTAYYTNIPPGKYRFIVRGSNNDGVWNTQEAALSIVILPPYWKTWWAYCIYVLIIAAICWLIFRYFSERKRLEDDIKLKQAEAKVQKEFHEARNKLFTNFSHELRTPLTLIMGPLEDMIDQKETSAEKYTKRLKLMQGNGYRLLRLVNNLMDFQKRESGKLQLSVSENDFIVFSKEMTDAFNELAGSRDILLRFTPSLEHLLQWFDRGLMEKVYFNFLSNAFKNVPNGGIIDVRIKAYTYPELSSQFPVQISSLSRTADYLLLEIEDTGVGIPQEELQNIFMPFYQVAQNEHSSSGTGLGLSLSKSIIEMHHGIVWAESPAGSGALFRIILPINKDLFTPEEIITDAQETEKHIAKIEIPIENEAWNEIEQEKNKRAKYTILVVEDNVDVRNYIVSTLSEKYKVLEAPNGMVALDKAFNHLPDLIISDLMMPKMDGMEMTRKLKNDLRTSHIPIIMLTARTMNEDKKEGYETGADDYIVKPFNSSVLLARVDNIIQSRENLKNIYGKRFTLDTLGVESTPVDELFMNKLYAILEKNISDPELDIDSISKDIGMSRSNLYRKIKSLTDIPPNEFIRNFRLEMAAKILREARIPIAEVYVAVGFSSHAYFSRCFKSLYGVSPTEYMAQNH